MNGGPSLSCTKINFMRSYSYIRCSLVLIRLHSGSTANCRHFVLLALSLSLPLLLSLAHTQAHTHPVEHTCTHTRTLSLVTTEFPPPQTIGHSTPLFVLLRSLENCTFSASYDAPSHPHHPLPAQSDRSLSIYVVLSKMKWIEFLKADIVSSKIFSAETLRAKNPIRS